MEMLPMFLLLIKHCREKHCRSCLPFFLFGKHFSEWGGDLREYPYQFTSGSKSLSSESSIFVITLVTVN